MQPARYKGAYGGRGSGKSHFFAELLVEACFMRTTRAVCIREVQKSLAQSVKKLIEDKIAKLGLQKFFEVTQNEIRGRNGSLIVFVGMQNHTADTIKSYEGFDIAWIEEAQSLSEISLRLLTPTIRKPGSEIWFSWNPAKATDPVDNLLRGEAPPKNAIIVKVNWSDNPWFPVDLFDDMQRDRERDPDEAAHVWDGAYRTASQARVFRKWRIEAFDTPDNAVHRFGADWGFASDPTVLVRAHIVGRELRIDYCVSGVGVEIDNTPAMFDRVPNVRKLPICADSARPETISYMRRSGFKVVSAVKGAGSIEEGVRFLQSFDLVVHPRCDALLRQELENYAYKVDPLTGEIMPILEDKFNNAIDALRYACEAVRRAGKPIESKPNTPNKRDYGLRKTEGENSWMTV